MKNKSSESVALAICIVLGLVLNVILSALVTGCISKILITGLEPINKSVQICNKDLGAFGGIAKIVSSDSDSIVYEAVNVRKKDYIFCCKDIVSWKVKDSKIVDVSARQVKTGSLMDNLGIKKAEVDSSDKKCTIMAKHKIIAKYNIIAEHNSIISRYNFMLGEILKSLNTSSDYEYEFFDCMTIFPDGRYYIKQGEQF